LTKRPNDSKVAEADFHAELKSFDDFSTAVIQTFIWFGIFFACIVWMMACPLRTSLAYSRAYAPF
jgi:hypothetical protein